jgi:hypothetical protein
MARLVLPSLYLVFNLEFFKERAAILDFNDLDLIEFILL